MVGFTILAITTDAEWLSVLSPGFHALGGTRIIVTESLKEASELLGIAGARLIVVHWSRKGLSYEQVDHLLWANTVLPRPVPVLVVADEYRANQALMLFRMGVDEYISRSHHVDDLEPVLSSLLATKPAPVLKREESALRLSRRAQHPLATRSWRVPAGSVV